MDNEVTYSIGEVAERLGLTVQAIRYYDAEGLLPLLKVGALRVIKPCKPELIS